MTDHEFSVSPLLRDFLAGVYGRDLPAPQRARYDAGLAAFRALHGPGAVQIFRAPGRVNLIGEHTDYNHGYVLPVALDRDIVLLARPRADAQVNLHNLEAERFGARHFILSGQTPPDPLGDWANYPKGAAQALVRRFGSAHAGMDALILGGPEFGVPIGAGLSSSSALTVVAGLALMGLNGWTLPTPELAGLFAEAEWYVGTRGGILDHFSSMLCQRGHALFLDCRPDRAAGGGYHVQHVPIPAGCLFAVCDSGKRRETAHSKYNIRVAECKIGVQLLHGRFPTITHLRDVSTVGLQLSPADLDNLLLEALPQQADFAALLRLGLPADYLRALAADHRLPADQVFAVQARCRHVISENQRVLDSVSALREGRRQDFGALMQQSHQSMSGDYAAGCAEVDHLVALLNEQPGVLGARITGAGWGGCAVALLEEGAEQGLAGRVAPAYRQRTGLELRVFPCRPADGAGGMLNPLCI